ncbi:MAG: threonine--tRNA ligase, partial [Acidimicrobiia bacterium]|nr:threonine--tRNA ligase [Acidimicrobiia bacterium]
MDNDRHEDEGLAAGDHRRLGQDLDLFAFDAEIGRGLPQWMPNGAAIRDALEDWARDTERRWGYQRVFTPHITNGRIFELSGHLPYFADDIYPPMATDDGDVYLRPMNCPFHMRVFAARNRSYRDLPLRFTEYGTVYRLEQSGELQGLLRVRGMTQNDAHIFCRLEDAKAEFFDVMRLHAHYYEHLGIEDFHMVLALRDPANVDKYHDDEAMWDTAERITREAMDESEIPYVEELGGAAHYGPKVDFVLGTAAGKEYA